MKTCSRCGETKPLDEFYQSHKSKDGLRNPCKRCGVQQTKQWRDENRDKHREYTKTWRGRNPERNLETIRAWKKSNPERARIYNLRVYGITIGEFDAMLDRQDGRCAICRTNVFKGRGNKPHVDHDHKTGRVRGLLCYSCNTGLGRFGDTLEGVMRAVEYLQRAEIEYES